MKLAFQFWRRQSWEGEARKHREMLVQPTNRIIHAAWRTLLKTIPVFKGRSIRYSLQGFVALTQTCTALRVPGLVELRRCWMQMRGAIVNHVNAITLDGIPFLFLVKMVSSAHLKYRGIGVSELGHACSTQEL